MADKKSEVYITVNHQQAETAVKQLKKSLASLTRQHEQLVAAGKEGTKRAKALWSQMNDLKAVIKENETNLKLVGNVMNNLSGSTLSQLNRALKNVKKEMSRVSGDNDRLEQLQAQYRAINEQIRIMKGEMVNVAKHIQNLSAVSDDWLTKAISQQKTLVATLRQGTPEYIKQLNALRTLNAEQVGRAQSAIASGNASAESLRASRATLTAYRDNIGTGALFDMGSAKENTQEIERINEVLTQIDNQLNSIQGKNAEITKSVAEVAEQAEKIKLDPNSFSPKEIKSAIDDINKKLQEMGVNDPMRTTLKQSATELEKILDGVDKELIDIAELLKPQNLSKASIDVLKKAAEQLEKEIKGMNREMGEFTEKQKQLTMIKDEIEQATGAVNKHSSAWQTTIRNISTYFGVFQLFSMIQDKLKAVISLNTKFSDQLADVRKVSGLAMSEINELAKSLSQIETRTTIEELNRISYIGSKLGFGQFGVEGLRSFTEAMNQANVALKEDLGDEAMSALAKITENMGTIKSMGVEKAILSTSSALFKLAATSTASAGPIVEFTKRLTAIAKQAGVTTAELLGLASASDSMMLMPEVSSTAFNKLLTAMQTNHKQIEQMLGMAEGTIGEFFKKGEMMDAVIAVFEKMKEKGNMSALKPIFKELGSDGARLNMVMTAMAGNVDMLKNHIQTSKQAFQEATAVTQEYNIQQETAAAYMERAANAFEKAFVNPNDVDVVKSLAMAWYDTAQALTKNQMIMMVLKGTIQMMISSVKILMSILPSLLAALGTYGLFSALKMVYKGLVDVSTGANTVITSFKKLSLASKAAGIVGLALTIFQIGQAMYEFAKKTRDAQKEMNGFTESTGELARQFAVAEDEARRYKKAIDDANVGTKEHEAAITNFNNKFGAYLTNLLTEKSTALDVANAYKEVCKQLRNKIALELKDKDRKDFVDPEIKKLADMGEDYDQKVKGSKFSQFNQTWVRSVIDDSGMEDFFDSEGSQAAWANDLAQRMGLSLTPQQIKDVRQQVVKGRQQYMKGHYQNIGTSSFGQNYSQFIDESTEDERGLFNALRYVQQEARVRRAQKKVNDKWDPHIDKTLAEGETQQQDHGDLITQTDPKKAAAEQKKRWREQLDEARKESVGIINNIKNYYERQITQVLKTANDNDWDETLTNSAVRAVQARMNLALMEARKSVAGIKSNWETFKETMSSDLREMADETGYNESQDLLDKILGVDTQELHDTIIEISNNLGIPAAETFSAMHKNATMGEKANETDEQKQRREKQNRLLERNYTAKVDNEYTESMETLGFFSLDDAQEAIVGSGDDAAIKAMLDKRSKEIVSLFKNARENIVDLYDIEVTTEEGRNRLMEILFGKNWDQDESELKNVFELYGDDIQVFYDELLKYSDAYTEALKRSVEQQKKILDFKWQRSAEYNTITTAQDTNAVQTSKVSQHAANAETPAPRNDAYGTGAFISSMGADPEVEAYRLKMEAAAAYYEFLAKHGADAQTLRDQERAVLQSEMEYAQSVANQMKQRIDDIYALAAPIESFGSAMGKAFATMTEDAEAGRAAIRAAIGDMINGFMEQTVKMTEEFIKRRLMQEMNDRLTSEEMRATAEEQKGIEAQKQSAINQEQQEGQSAKTSIFKKLSRSFTKLFKKQEKTEITAEQKKQDEILDVQESGGEAQEILNVDVKKDIMGATEEIGAQTLAVQQQQTSTEVATESAKTQANTVMGIASGAAKVIGSLGWWGIPLVAVITALLNGLLAFAMGKVSSLFGGGSDTGSDSGPATKLVTGMLTYDSGNVQSFDSPDAPRKAPGSLDSPSASKGDTRPVLGADGNVYNAREAGELQTGMVTEPITTLVNGQPAIVGEKGPEMVIGRETTEALQMARPDIIRDIIKFDKNFSGRGFRLFDSGNVGDLDLGDGNSPAGLQTEDIERLNNTISALGSVLTLIQQKGIPAHINKYGRGGVTNEAASGRDFMKTFSGDPLWKRD